MATRRQVLRAGLQGVAALGTARLLTSCSPIFTSPGLEPFVDPLVVPTPQAPGAVLTAASGSHRFHSSLPANPTIGLGGEAFGGPWWDSHAGDPVHTTLANRLGRHPLAEHVDTTVHGTVASDRERPRLSLHLHGGVIPASQDGHPLDTIAPGADQTYDWPNHQEAATLWFHDHALGITRLNVHAGIFGLYTVRDEVDTGAATNPLGLPTGEFEIPLVLQDRGFDADGRSRFRAFSFVPEGNWEGGMIGDTIAVNGTVWPRLDVARGRYRFRILNASNLTTYHLTLGDGRPFVVIGNDHGLLDAPVPTADLRISPGERIDVLVDFSDAEPGTRIVMRNDHPQPLQAEIFGTTVIPHVMAFDVGAARGHVGPIAERLRIGPTAPLPTLAQMAARRSSVRNVTLSQVGTDRNPPAWMTLDNVGFDVEAQPARQGTVEQWNFINTTLDDHPMHIHLARFRVLERVPINPLLYQLIERRPDAHTEWHPSADAYATGRPTPPDPWERGWKDTVIAPGNSITRVLVEWPTAEHLGFDPDEPYRVSVPDPAPAWCPIGGEVQGYVFHCHVLDHEDNEMMRPIRVIA